MRLSLVLCRLGFHNPDFWEAKCLRCDTELVLPRNDKHRHPAFHRYRVKQPEDETIRGGTE